MILNAYRPTQVLLDETERVDAQTTRRLYEQLLAAHLGMPTIYVVCDNARYYHNKEFTAWLIQTRIRQVLLLPYAPNLNLIRVPVKIPASEDH